MSRPGSLRTASSLRNLSGPVPHSDEDRTVNNGSNPAFTFIYIAAAEGKTYLHRCNERTRYQIQSCKQYFKRKLGMKQLDKDIDDDFIKQYWERKSRQRIGAVSSMSSLRSTGSLSSWYVPVEYRTRSSSSQIMLTPSSSINTSTTPSDESRSFSMSNISRNSSSTDATAVAELPPDHSGPVMPPLASSSSKTGIYSAHNANYIGSVPTNSLAAPPAVPAATPMPLSAPAPAAPVSESDGVSHLDSPSKTAGTNTGACTTNETNHRAVPAPQPVADDINDHSFWQQHQPYHETPESDDNGDDDDDDEDPNDEDEESDRLLCMIEEGLANEDRYVEVSYSLINRLAKMNNVALTIDPAILAYLQLSTKEQNQQIQLQLDSAPSLSTVTTVASSTELNTISEDDEEDDSPAGRSRRANGMGQRIRLARTKIRRGKVMMKMSLKHLAVFAGKFSHRFNYRISRGDDDKLQFYISGINDDHDGFSVAQAVAPVDEPAPPTGNRVRNGRGITTIKEEEIREEDEDEDQATLRKSSVSTVRHYPHETRPMERLGGDFYGDADKEDTKAQFAITTTSTTPKVQS